MTAADCHPSAILTCAAVPYAQQQGAAAARRPSSVHDEPPGTARHGKARTPQSRACRSAPKKPSGRTGHLFTPRPAKR